VYNYYLNKREVTYKTDGKTMGHNACSNDLTRLKKELPWLKEPDSIALQASLENLQDAYDRFFQAYKRSDTSWGKPSFKSKKNNHKSYTTKCVNGNIQIYDCDVKLPKLGLIKCRVSKQTCGRILNVTISKTPSGKYFVSICCTDVVHPQLEKTGRVIGLDLGLKDFVVDSEGNHYKNKKHLHKHEKKLARLQRQHSRKQIGSNNRDKARIKVARVYEHIVNSRSDAHHKLSTKIVKNNDIIIIEELKVKNMVKNRRLSKSISDAGWGEFARQLEYKAAWYGKRLYRTDTFFASSQYCSAHGCTYKNSDTKKLSVREWICPQCGVYHERDENAAKNILNEGLRLLSA